MKSIYFKNFAATAAMVMFSFLILGAAFVFLGRSYVISEYRGNMVSNAEEVSHAAQALVRDGELSNWDLRMVISTLAQSTGNHIFITTGRSSPARAATSPASISAARSPAAP